MAKRYRKEWVLELPEKLAFLLYPAPYKIAYGGRNSAKSWSFARALLKRGIEKSTRILCAREVQVSIKHSVHKLLSDQIKREGLQGDYEVLETSIRGKHNDTEFLFIGLLTHTIDSMKSYEGCDICWVEEAQTVSKRSWDILDPTIRKEGAEIWVSFNPRLDTDETYQRFVLNPLPGSVVAEINYTDNPWFNELMEQKRLHCKETDPDNYPNIWEGKCLPAVEGAIYFNEVQAAQSQGRICNVPYDPMLKVHVVFDIGWSDYMGVALVQRGVSDLRVIKYFQDCKKDISYYSGQIKPLNYNWGKVWLPHDGFAHNANVKDNGTSQTILQALGWKVPNRNEINELGIGEGIRQTRLVLPRMYFDKTNAADLIECMKRYRRIVNSKTGVEGTPVHDEWSHGADVLRYIAVNAALMTNDCDDIQPEIYSSASYGARDDGVGL